MLMLCKRYGGIADADAHANVDADAVKVGYAAVVAKRAMACGEVKEAMSACLLPKLGSASESSSSGRLL